MMVPTGEQTFIGTVVDRFGKTHNLRRVYCAVCGSALSEMHHGCCGHASSGWGTSAPHKCEETQHEPQAPLVG